MNATQPVIAAVRASYMDLLLSVPLVATGIVVTGSIFYLLVVRPRMSDRSARGWIGYLFPTENYTSSSARVDVWVWFINGLLFIPILEAAIAIGGLIAGVGFDGALVKLFGPVGYRLEAAWLVAGMQFTGFYFGFGLGQYIGHLSFHKVPVLWAIHRAHHSAESANLFAFLRTHPIEVFVCGIFRALMSAGGIGLAIYVTNGKLLPETAALIVWYNILYVLAGFRSLDHTHIPLSYGKVLDILVGSPVLHQVHHSAELRHRDVNMAGAGYIYDWLFGTLYLPEKGESWRWGLREEELGAHNPHQRVRDFFFEPWYAMRAELRNRGKADLNVDARA